MKWQLFSNSGPSAFCVLSMPWLYFVQTGMIFDQLADGAASEIVSMGANDKQYDRSRETFKAENISRVETMSARVRWVALGMRDFDGG